MPQQAVGMVFYFDLIYFVVLQVKSRALCMTGKHSTMEIHPQPPLFVF